MHDYRLDMNANITRVRLTIIYSVARVYRVAVTLYTDYFHVLQQPKRVTSSVSAGAGVK